VLADPRVRAKFRGLLASLAAESTGSSTMVARALLLDTPPSIDANEITDKGSLNQRAVLANRSALVADLYALHPSPGVMTPADPWEDS
jgi:feruloyl-CoA synthase